MMKELKLRYLLSIILMVGFSIFAFSAQNMQGGAKRKKVILYDNTPREIPDFKANFEVLRKNRVLYNAYNDSIFLIHDHDQWVSFFRRRALKNHQLFLANKIALSNIFDYFKQDTIPAVAYTQLIESFWNNSILKDTSDPFLAMEVYQLMDEFNNVCPDSLNTSCLVSVVEGVACQNINNLTKDTVFLVKSANCLKRVLSDKAKNYLYYKEYYPLALWNLCNNIYLINKVITLQEHNEYLAKLKKWYQEYKDSDIISEWHLSRMKSFIMNHDETIMRNVYLNDTTVMDKQVAENLMRKVIERNLKNPNLSHTSYLNTLVMQEKLGQISASHAVKLALDAYRKYWKDLGKQQLSAGQLKDFLMPFFAFFYLNDISDESYSKKRRIVKKMCGEIELAYQHRRDDQRYTNYVKYLNQFTTYPRVTKYLKPSERVHFLNTLNVATQVTTYAHSVHVSIIAEQLMRGILAYQPELLIGALGDFQVTEILKNKQKYLDFIHDAGMYHDIGKNTIASVVNNDYRPLTDLEFSIIKKHPEMGLEYLKLSPDLAKFHDTTLGHHKWYNGKGGYPASFDNTQSPKRIMIDIVTLSDCLQAATERIGRNYKGDKTFDTVMSEFRRDAGVRYNPDLVSLIDEHPDLAKKLANLIEDGWVDIYYNIYSQYFVK